MKKSLVSTFTAAMVIGAAGTTFAAANPFSDVPADHWAYDAVTQLAADGVIEGYGNSTFKGDRSITRYEMAQMVAKAMAKQNVGGTDKALIDKLAAEFADELNNLGVRVAQLEKNADKVQWHGMLRYDYGSLRYDKAPIDLYVNGGKVAQKGDTKVRANNNSTTFRLEPIAEVNDHWKVRARLDAYGNMKNDFQDTLGLKRLWAEGRYGNTTWKFGRMPVGIDMDIMFDTHFSGAQVAFGKKKGLITTINAGRFTLSSGNEYFRYAKDWAEKKGVKDATASYQAIGLNVSAGKWTNTGVAYHHLDSDDFGFLPGYGKAAIGDNAHKHEMNVVTSKATYHFNKNWTLQYNYGHNFAAENYNDSFHYVLGYKDFENFNTEHQGQWGASVAYRYVGQNVGPTATYTMDPGTKGLALSIIGNPMKHTYTWLQYEVGKTLIGNHNYKELFGRMEWQF
ncbi:S-layer homology domain-containing protein [Selenomonas montiformis]|uniref:S-layer homology domain-containing protein n=1 Tax=Selenomonas montiformis TaxID=2652285 RepID=UPI0039F5494E